MLAKKKSVSFTLTGTTKHLSRSMFTIEKAIARGFIHPVHKQFYLNTFTARTAKEQDKYLQEAGLSDAKIVGLDLEWGGPRYKKKPQKSTTLRYWSCRVQQVCARSRDVVFSL